jgi:hypothetical protein
VGRVRERVGQVLQKLGSLTRDVEDLGLEELQGARGLRALRVTADLANQNVSGPAPLGRLPATIFG